MELIVVEYYDDFRHNPVFQLAYKTANELFLFLTLTFNTQVSFFLSASFTVLHSFTKATVCKAVRRMLSDRCLSVCVRVRVSVL